MQKSLRTLAHPLIATLTAILVAACNGGGGNGGY
jgi:predicted small secreted protein